MRTIFHEKFREINVFSRKKFHFSFSQKIFKRLQNTWKVRLNLEFVETWPSFSCFLKSLENLSWKRKMKFFPWKNVDFTTFFLLFYKNLIVLHLFSLFFLLLSWKLDFTEKLSFFVFTKNFQKTSKNVKSPANSKHQTLDLVGQNLLIGTSSGPKKVFFRQIDIQGVQTILEIFGIAKLNIFSIFASFRAAQCGNSTFFCQSDFTWNQY